MDQIEDVVPNAVRVLSSAIQGDIEYAWAWHCQIAVSAIDEGTPHEVAQRTATRTMKLLFGVDTWSLVAFHFGYEK